MLEYHGLQKTYNLNDEELKVVIEFYKSLIQIGIENKIK